MKKKLVSLVLCMALLSSFTISASAYDVNDIYNQVTAIRNELGYPQGNWSSLRRAVNYIADHMPDASPNYSTVLSNIKSNSDSLVSYIKLIEGDTNNISARSTELLNKLNEVYVRQGQMQIAITNHIDSASAQNHSDLSSLQSFFNKRFSNLLYYNDTSASDPYVVAYYNPSDASYHSSNIAWGDFIAQLYLSLTYDGRLYTDQFGYRRSLYGMISQLQQVLASDDDLALKNDNKANEDAATGAFVNGNSSKTSLGTGDIGNLKDVGGTFNDLTSLNGQSSVSSFLSGLTSADGTGQGWFSEATRASLDAVSAPVTPTRLVRKTWRGEKSLTYSISEDTSVNVVRSPAPARAPAVDHDPYNMSGFADNYNWLWGDVS